MQSYMTISMIHMSGRVYGYVCVLCVYNTYLYAHIYYAISVYVCGEHTRWFSPDIYSCIRILNMYIECRCPAYTCVYVMNLGWQFIFIFIFFYFLQVAGPYEIFSLRLHYIEEMEKCVIKVLF